MPRSTVGAILSRLALGKLKALEPRPPVIRYERPCEMNHQDIKTLGRFLAEGRRVTGERQAGRSRRAG